MQMQIVGPLLRPWRGLGATAVVSTLLLIPFAASAQELEEIVVTAQKRAQNLQDVGTSITAFDGAQLQRLGMVNTTDIAMQVPGLQFNQFAPTITIFNIRGVSQNDFSDHQEAPVAVYSDEAYVASMGAIAGSMYDLERVEVLRGPQGTLFGRNATGGLLHFISQKPTDTPEAYIEVTGARFGQISTQGAVNGPLGDRVAARFSFATDYHQGIIDNRIGPDNESQRQYAARLQLLFKLNDEASFLLKLHGVRNDHESTNYYSWAAAYPNAQGLGTFLPSNLNYWGAYFPPGCAGCDPGGYKNPSTSPFSQATSMPGYFDRKIYGATGHLDWSFGPATLTSITDYMQMRKTYSEESDVAPQAIWNNFTDQAYHQFSQEVRLNGKAGPLTWLGGLYYFDSFSNNSNYLAASPIFAVFGLGPSFGALYSLRTRSYAAFTQEEWAFTDKLSAILGARVTHDEKIDNYSMYQPFAQTALFTFNTSNYGDLADRRWTIPSGKIELDYKITPDVLTYGSISRGVKSGGFEAPTVPPPPDPKSLSFNPEKLISYEVGAKTTFFGGMARLNASVFYYDYRDYQAFDLVNVSQSIVNVNAKVKGGEAELTLAPVKGLQVQLGVSGLDAIVKNLTIPDGETLDRIMPQSPKWSVNGLVRYQWSAVGNSTWWVQADAKAQTDEYFAAFNAPIDHEPGYTVVNTRVGFTDPSGKLDITLFCNNVMDRRYRLYDLDGSSVGFAVQTFAPPRWYGATVAYHWH